MQLPLAWRASPFDCQHIVATGEADTINCLALCVLLYDAATVATVNCLSNPIRECVALVCAVLESYKLINVQFVHHLVASLLCFWQQ